MEYLIHLAILVLLFGLFAISLNLVVGVTGLLSIAAAAFMGIGAYTTAILTTRYHVDFFVSVLAGIILTIIASFLIGLVLSRFRDDYFALVSLGFMVITHSFFLNLEQITNGSLGITGIMRPAILGSDPSNVLFMLLLLFVFACIYVLANYLTSSPFGRILKAIREDEKTIQVFGYNTLYFKLTIFVISAVIASLAGSFFASYITYIDPSSFTIAESVFILSIVILGGLASLHGSILGAAFLVLLPEGLRFLGFPQEIAGEMRLLAYGLLLALSMIYKPQGLFGDYKL